MLSLDHTGPKALEDHGLLLRSHVGEGNGLLRCFTPSFGHLSLLNQLETSGRIAARLPPIDVGLGYGAALVAPGPALFLVQGTDTDVRGLPLPDLALAYCLLLRLGLGRREQTGARGPNLTGQSRRVLFVMLALGMGVLRDNPCFFDFPLALGLGGLVCQREASVLIEGVQRMCHIVPEHNPREGDRASDTELEDPEHHPIAKLQCPARAHLLPRLRFRRLLLDNGLLALGISLVPSRGQAKLLDVRLGEHDG
mmetsp:Transcript_23801/g.49244  ORF Transcript_23801/g.49244 Transcript_23801/m.49244 type:complete len:253 (-) Transcript_23801:1449-2207(-)